METQTLIVILNLFILESLLSIDNAAVLAVMVKDLPPGQRTKALRYGLLGAYAFRFLCLFIASWLIKIVWLKIVGGAYLLYLTYGHFFGKEEEDNGEPKAKLIGNGIGGLGVFWSTVLMVEIMDLAFSIDNIFAAVALSNNMYVIMAGVGIGILAMRFVSGWFSKLMAKFPSLEPSAFVVIALLGLKLIAAGSLDYMTGWDYTRAVLNSHTFDLLFSAAMMLVFFFPLLIKPLIAKKQ